MASRRFAFHGGRRLSPQQRQRLLARYRQSQLTQRAFAQRHGLGLSTLGKWLREAGPKGQPVVKFQEVMWPSTSGGWALELVSPQGWTVRLAQMSGARSLRQLLGALPC